MNQVLIEHLSGL